MLEAIGHRIIVEPDPVDNERDLGDGRKLEIVVDENKESAAQIVGTVVQIGPTAWRDFNKDYTNEPWAEIGDKVMYSRYGGKRVQDPENYKEYVILNDEDILCKVIKE